MEVTRPNFPDLILDELIAFKNEIKKDFNQSGRINSCIIDNLLPEEVMKEIYKAYPSPKMWFCTSH